MREADRKTNHLSAQAQVESVDMKVRIWPGWGGGEGRTCWRSLPWGRFRSPWVLE